MLGKRGVTFLAGETHMYAQIHSYVINVYT